MTRRVALAGSSRSRSLASLGVRGAPAQRGERRANRSRAPGLRSRCSTSARGVPEKEEAGLFGPPPGRRRAFDSLIKIIDEAQKDKDTQGPLRALRSGDFGMARAQELGEALADARAKHARSLPRERARQRDAASSPRAGARKITLAPAGEVEAVGIAAQVIYMHKLLAEELHLDVDILQVGKFKGAEEPLTRDGPSPEARESLESVLVDLRAAWLDGIDKGRDGRAGARDAAEDGPFSATAAKDARARRRGRLPGRRARTRRRAACGAVREVVRFGPGARNAGPDIDDLLEGVRGRRDDDAAGHGAPRRRQHLDGRRREPPRGDEGITEKALAAESSASPRTTP